MARSLPPGILFPAGRPSDILNVSKIPEAAGPRRPHPGAVRRMNRRTRTLILALYLLVAALLLAGMGVYGSRRPASLGPAFAKAAGRAGELIEKAGEPLRRVIRPARRQPPAAALLADRRGRPEADRPAPPLAPAAAGQAPAVYGSPPGFAGPAEAAEAAAPAPAAPRRIKGPEEERVERIILAAYQEYIREYTLWGERLTVRMPFALNDEREGGRGYTQEFYLDGKGRPDELWPLIDSVLFSEKFARYAQQITAPGEKVIIFNLKRRSYHLSWDPPLIESLRAGSYPGTPTRIYVRRGEGPLSGADVYNYLYAVACVGVDCSGLVYYLHESIARAYGFELDRALGARLRARPRDVRKRFGVWLFDPRGGYTEAFADRIEDLRPADMILFRGSDGTLKHSAIVQSIDLQQGIIRYVQSTDWAIEADRGVHLSEIRFDPARAGESLRHYSVRWLQQVRPPFEGEEEPRDWLSDEDRYLWYTEAGGSLVARPRYLAAAFLEKDPRFYTNVYPEERPLPGGGSPAGGDPTASGRQAAPPPSRSP